MKKTIFLLGLLSLLIGCVPTSQRYQQVEAPGARYLPGACDSSGPRYWSYFPMNGIFVSLDLSGRLFGIHYPEAATVQLDSNELIGTGSRDGQAVTWRALLKPTKHFGHLADPVEFQDMIDPITSSSDRNTRTSMIIWANYYMSEPNLPNHIVAIPQNLEQATIRIPPMTINGTKYEAQDLHIVQRTHSWMAPVNGC